MKCAPSNQKYNYFSQDKNTLAHITTACQHCLQVLDKTPKLARLPTNLKYISRPSKGTLQASLHQSCGRSNKNAQIGLKACDIPATSFAGHKKAFCLL